MKTVFAAVSAAALLALAPAAHAQEGITSMLAGTLDQFGQSLGESATAGESIFVSALGKAPIPGGAAVTAPFSVTLSSEGDTAVAATRARDKSIADIRAVARRFGVSVEVGETSYAVGESYDWEGDDYSYLDGLDIYDDGDDAGAITDESVAAAMAADTAAAAADAAAAEADKTFTASTTVTVGRPAESRMADFIDELAEAGVTNFGSSLTGMSELGSLGVWASLLGLAPAADPGEAVWGAATTDAIGQARMQAQQVASASGRALGHVKNVTVFLRSQDGKNAYVTVSVRFGFAD